MRLYFTECVAKGFCFLSCGGMDCLRVVFVLRVSNLVAAVSVGKVRKGDVLGRVKCMSRGRRGTLWHSSESCFAAL